MAHPDPSSESKRINPIDDEADALWEPLPMGKEHTLNDSTFNEIDNEIEALPDEERLYTDAVIRQNENASRFLFFSFMLAGLVSIILGFWYVIAQQKPQSTQPNTPLQVPTTPPIAPLPDLNLTPPPLPTSNPVPQELPTSPLSPSRSPNLQLSPNSSPPLGTSAPLPLSKPTGTEQVNPTLPPPPPAQPSR